MNDRRMSDILTRKTPKQTKEVVRALGVKNSDDWMSPEEVIVIRSLLRFWDRGLIEYVGSAGWVLTRQGQLMKQIKENTRLHYDQD